MIFPRPRRIVYSSFFIASLLSVVHYVQDHQHGDQDTQLNPGGGHAPTVMPPRPFRSASIFASVRVIFSSTARSTSGALP